MISEGILDIREEERTWKAKIWVNKRDFPSPRGSSKLCLMVVANLYY